MSPKRKSLGNPELGGEIVANGLTFSVVAPAEPPKPSLTAFFTSPF